jgi:putative spermidine/putrescine transport system ATP-binding protein
VAAPARLAGAEVRLEGVTKTYGDVAAVNDVSVTMGGGTFFTLLGPSGSGKTTTLMMIAGFAHPSAGDILVDGVPVTGLAPEKRDLGVVFQSYALFPHLTVAENIAFPLKVRRVGAAESRRRVGEMLDLVRLAGYENRRPSQLSGGEQQRVALARALVFQPRVLLMDEPLGALDRKLRTHMQLELRQLQRELDVTVVYVTHDQEEALTMSTTVAVMRGGRIEQVGRPAELYESPRSRFVAEFLGESNAFEAVVADVPGAGACVVRTADGLAVRGTAVEALRVGDAVDCTVRPEKLVLGGVLDGAANQAKAVIEDSTYVGDVTRYRVRLDGGAALQVKVMNQLGAPAPAVGDCVSLAWTVADTRVFARTA